MAVAVATATAGAAAEAAARAVAVAAARAGAAIGSMATVGVARATMVTAPRLCPALGARQGQAHNRQEEGEPKQHNSIHPANLPSEWKQHVSQVQLQFPTTTPSSCGNPRQPGAANWGRCENFAVQENRWTRIPYLMPVSMGREKFFYEFGGLLLRYLFGVKNDKTYEWSGRWWSARHPAYQRARGCSGRRGRPMMSPAMP